MVSDAVISRPYVPLCVRAQGGGVDVLNSEVWEARDLFDLG